MAVRHAAWLIAIAVLASILPPWSPSSSSSASASSSSMRGVSWGWGPGLGVMAMSTERRLALRDEVGELFKHGYEGYMKHAYPADNLRPISCRPLGRDPDPNNYGINDISPNASITLLDVLSSLPLLHPTAFPDALRRIATEVSFDQDVKVQVFEMTIRALGSLLSTWQFLDELPDDPADQADRLGLGGTDRSGRNKVDVKQYKGRLMELAIDLAERFKPAFATATGLPFARVNLRHGVERGESAETCLAGAGSLLLEFGVLSRLTGDDSFETLAHQAFMSLWNRRSHLNLLGNTIAVTHGHWLAPGLAGVGAGMDSFFEYAMKAAILFSDDRYLDIFQDSYAAIQTYVRTPDGFIYRPVQLRNLQTASTSTIDSLSAFLPGLQVLAGDVESAIQNHLVWWNLWRRYSATPESWAWEERAVEWAGWPLRPEYIESTYYLYQATRDPFYLRVGERFLSDIKRRVKTKCGFAILRNVETGELEDRMESFMLSETLKYLYLLFDAASPGPSSNKVFTTEGHLLSLPHRLLKPPPAVRRALHRGENQQCPAYLPPTLNGIVAGIEHRADYDYARSLVFGPSGADLSADVNAPLAGICVAPSPPRWSFEVVLAATNATSTTIPPEGQHSLVGKVHRDDPSGALVISDVQGVILNVRWRLDGTGYDVSSIGPHRVRPGQQVLVTDASMSEYLPVMREDPIVSHTPPEVLLRFSAKSSVFLHAIGATATFGRSFSSSPDDDGSSWAIGSGRVSLTRPRDNTLGCEPFSSPIDGVVLLDRGGCTFFLKLLHAARAGAAGVLTMNYAPEVQAEITRIEGRAEDGLIRPSADDEDPDLVHAVRGAGLAFIEYGIGQRLVAELEAGTRVSVDVLRLDGSSGPCGHESVPLPPAMSGRDRQVDLGMVMVGDWPIRNLRVVDSPP